MQQQIDVLEHKLSKQGRANAKLEALLLEMHQKQEAMQQEMQLLVAEQGGRRQQQSQEAGGGSLEHQVPAASKLQEECRKISNGLVEKPMQKVRGWLGVECKRFAECFLLTHPVCSSE